MTTVIAAVYAIGVAGGFFIVGATGARWWNNGDPGPAFLPFFWPLAFPWAVGRFVACRRERARLDAEERRRWLEAKVPE